MKRDAIFLTACGITALGIIISALGFQVGLLLFVVAYLLRPALREFGLTPRLADEREAMIHSRSGDLAFIVTILAASAFALFRAALGEQPEELYEIIAIGLVTRAVSGLVLAADYRKAGSLIIAAVGFFLGVFIILDAGFSVPGLFGVGVAALIIGFAWWSKRAPLASAVILTVLAVAAIFNFNLLRFDRTSAPVWLFLITPLLIAAVCLFLGRKGEDVVVSGRLKLALFGALGIGAALVFSLTMIFGSTSDRVKETAGSHSYDAGSEQVVSGISCTGRVTTYADGSLLHAVLARADTVSGRILPAGTTVHFQRDGSLRYCFLPGETVLDGHLCRGGGHDFMTHVFPNGALKLIWLGRDETIQGVPCASFDFFGDVFGGASFVEFYDNGQIKHAKLSRDMTIQGRLMTKGDHVNFDSAGALLLKTDH